MSEAIRMCGAFRPQRVTLLRTCIRLYGVSWPGMIDRLLSMPTMVLTWLYHRRSSATITASVASTYFSCSTSPADWFSSFWVTNGRVTMDSSGGVYHLSRVIWVSILVGEVDQTAVTFLVRSGKRGMVP